MELPSNASLLRLQTRRELLRQVGMGMGTIGLGALLGREVGAATSKPTGLNDRLNPLSPLQPQYRARAKRVIHIFANGGPSQVDTFDYKPALAKYDGKELPNSRRTERKTGAAMKSPFEFRQYGQSGHWISDLFPHVAESADELCIINSMHANVPNHEPSLMLMNCGAPRTNSVTPSMGSWINYGLGTENENLPGFVSLCPGGVPVVETQNWRSAFLPGAYQGTHIDTKNTEIEKLIANIENKKMPRSVQRQQLDLIQQLNHQHQEERAGDPQLEARIQSYELAYRMQMEATDAFDVSKEPESIREAYGDDLQGRQMLIARRLVERGVRFVQVWHGAGQPWDSHDHIEKNHGRLAGEADRAIGALLKDLKNRGLLDDTLVIWGGEFGRTPTVELPTPGANGPDTKLGRDHNHYGFSMWLAGGGVKGGYRHGSTDEFGFAAEEDPVHVHDLHATILHLLGFDHLNLTYRYAGRDFRLTDLAGKIVHELVA